MYEFFKATSRKHSKAQNSYIKVRSEIIVLSHANISSKEIAFFSGLHISTVIKWIKRFKIGKTLHDLPRGGRPAVFGELIQLKITAFFCQANPLPGCNTITLQWAAKYFHQNISFLGCTISISSISRILRKHSLRPHLHKYFLQITDPDFFAIMPSLINLYLNPPENLFCFDECPGIQALKKTAPPLPVGEGKNGGQYSEPNYNRNGTRDLYAFFNVNTGTVFGKCTKNHKVETLIQIFQEHVKSLPKNSIIHYICDNLSNHSCHKFCSVVAKLCSVEYPEKELDTKKKRQTWLQKENKRIVIHFTPKHGSWLNMVEIWFGIMGQKCLKHNSFSSVDKLAAFLHDFIQTWNKYFAHPFNWTYTGKGLHSRAIKRLVTHFIIENKHMELSFLSSQLELMLNLFEKHFKQVDIKDWIMLEKVIKSKRNFIESIIKSSDKPRVQTKTEKLFSKLINELDNWLSENIKCAA